MTTPNTDNKKEGRMSNTAGDRKPQTDGNTQRDKNENNIFKFILPNQERDKKKE